MKKLLLLLVVGLLALSLCACGEKESAKPNESGSGSSSSSSNEGENGQKEVVSTNPYNANLANDVIDALISKVESIDKKHRENQAAQIENNPDLDLSTLTNIKYDLVYFDNNDVPELVVTDPGFRTALFVIDGKKISYAMKDADDPEFEEGWPFGVSGNVGYDYIPRGNSIRCFSNEAAGLIRYTDLWHLDSATKQLVPDNEFELVEYHFVDKDGNGKLDPGEETEHVFEPTAYFYGDQQVTSGEFYSHMVIGDYEELSGSKSLSEMKTALEGMKNTK